MDSFGAAGDLGVAPSADEEFDRQLHNLLDKGYPALADRSAAEFTALVEPLRDLLDGETTSDDGVPFLIVVARSLVATVDAVGLFDVLGKRGFTEMADEIEGYQPIDGVDVPAALAYLLVDVTTGKDTLNVRPNDALPSITDIGRTPLTVDEGVALVTHCPDVFAARNAFQALGSRNASKRIPSFWMSKGAPRLGWCWAGNPHTWLGAASAAARRGPDAA
ncbi:MAG: hypothetical protein H0W95_01845 [Nocardioidaceae bacterium]|nr:hypothetical protein [Nocardioidaceae bacterium]